MEKRFINIAGKTAAIIIMLSTTAACSSMQEKISNIGKEPALSQIENPVAAPDHKPVSLPMPPREIEQQSANSLWGTDRQTFFKDQRASAIGDILTVLIEIDDEADIENTTERKRSGSEDMGVSGMFGLDNQVTKKLSGDVDPSALVGTDAASASKGEGTISRAEKVSLKLAVTIIQKLPNGNLVVSGRQQVRVNHELRDLIIEGVIRPQDISSTNSISYEKIAEARISYGGKGNISELQQTRYGQQFLEAVLPF